MDSGWDPNMEKLDKRQDRDTKNKLQYSREDLKL